MADIVCSTYCTSWLDGHAIPTDCASVDFGFPSMVILAAPDTTFSFSSDNLVPTVAEFTTAGSDIFIISDIANGVKMAPEIQSISAADTPDNLEEVISEMDGISGNIVRFNTDIYNDLEKLNCYKRLRMWYVTNKGYCFGGLTGYLIKNYIPDWTHDGYGNRSKFPFEFRWFKTPATTTGTAQDMAYLDLTN
jgi:hypothetical protein